MEYRKLGSTGLEVSRIGFGCWAIGGHGYGKVDDAESIRAVRKALDAGVNFFDTADVYGFGHSEEVLSKALATRRTSVVIATKFGVTWDRFGRTSYDCSPKRVVEALENSLRRLRLEAIPLYQIHWYDNVTPLSETLEALKRCQEAGKIRYIGCSNFPLQLLSQADKLCRIESLQRPYNLLERDFEGDMTTCLGELNVSVIAYNVLARGLFSGKYTFRTVFGEADTRSLDSNFRGDRLKRNLEFVARIKEIGRAYQKTPSQVAIRWALDNERVTSALVGAVTKRQVLENVGAADWNLSSEDYRYLKEEADRTMEAHAGEDACASGKPVATS
jgi:aryl-alcohol dehydrogenase-like predicted oxidoreductase